MKIYSKNGAFPQPIPFRIYLSDGTTRTDPSSFTDEEIADAGFVEVPEKPTVNEKTQTCNWDTASRAWIVADISPEDIAAAENSDLLLAWEKVRQTRDNLINSVEWRVSRYNSQVRLGITPIDNISQLDTYIQALRDITNAESIDAIVWPNLDGNPSEGQDGV